MLSIDIPKNQVEEFCKKNLIKKFSFFGSVTRADFSPKSDIDVIVEFYADRSPGFFGLAQMRRELSMIFGGRKIDLLTPKGISKYLRKEILSSAIIQYAE
jgi:uncharacterized protein